MHQGYRENNAAGIKQRFERDAVSFDNIYQSKNSEFKGLFNRLFRKPIFERHDICFEVMGDLHKKTILDVGCGSGVYSLAAALKGAMRVKGVDFSAPMLQIARERAQNHQVNAFCEFELIDFMKFNSDEKFNYVIAMGVFDYLADPLIFLKQLKNFTKDRIIASFPGHSLIREPLRKLRYRLTKKGDVYFYRHDEIERLGKKIGFRRTEIRPLTTGSGYILIADL